MVQSGDSGHELWWVHFTIDMEQNCLSLSPRFIIRYFIIIIIIDWGGMCVWMPFAKRVNNIDICQFNCSPFKTLSILIKDLNR